MTRLTDVLTAEVPDREAMTPVQLMQQAKRVIVQGTSTVETEYRNARQEVKRRIRAIEGKVYADQCREQMQEIGMPEYVLCMPDHAVVKVHNELRSHTGMVDELDDPEMPAEAQAAIDEVNAAVPEPRVLAEARDEHIQLEREAEEAQGYPLVQSYHVSDRYWQAKEEEKAAKKE